MVIWKVLSKLRKGLRVGEMLPKFCPGCKKIIKKPTFSHAYRCCRKNVGSRDFGDWKVIWGKHYVYCVPKLDFKSGFFSPEEEQFNWSSGWEFVFGKQFRPKGIWGFGRLFTLVWFDKTSCIYWCKFLRKHLRTSKVGAGWLDWVEPKRVIPVFDLCCTGSSPLFVDGEWVSITYRAGSLLFDARVRFGSLLFMVKSEPKSAYLCCGVKESEERMKKILEEHMWSFAREIETGGLSVMEHKEDSLGRSSAVRLRRPGIGSFWLDTSGNIWGFEADEK